MSKIIKLPGLIDPHVHLRDPGQTYKEDFYTGTSAALAGGYTTILDMPNNLAPVTTLGRLENKIKIAKEKILCDVGFHFGSLGDNLDEFEKISEKVIGLKLYLSQTTGGFIIPKKKAEAVFRRWPKNKVILVHAENKMLDYIIKLVSVFKNKVYICHVGRKDEIIKIRKAKDDGLAITFGTTPHYLFLTNKDFKKNGPFAFMKPPLGSKKDQDFLWKNIRFVDVIESDHAPHTIEEKESNRPPFGVPGLETTLPLLLTAAAKGRITIEQIVEKCYENPAKIFNIKTNEKTHSEVDLNQEYVIENKNLKTKCGWSPFAGWKVKGKVKRVFIRGKKVYEGEKVLLKPGSGKILQPIKES